MICPVCGANQQAESTQQQQVQQPVADQQPNQNQGNTEAGGKEKSTTTILALLPLVIQIHGIHRFYTGHIGIGIIQFLTAGGCWIWTIIDLVNIFQGKYTDAEGKPLKGKGLF